jgi:transposase
MPQLQLPIFPQGVTEITANLAFGREGERVTYYYGTLPVFSHQQDDLATFRMITSQFVEAGHVTQAQIARAFGIALVTVKRSVKRYREEGVRGFYAERKTRGAAVLTEAVLIQVQQRLDDGITVKDIAAELNLKADTLNKAVRAGRLHVPKKNTLKPK